LADISYPSLEFLMLSNHLVKEDVEAISYSLICAPFYS